MFSRQIPSVRPKTPAKRANAAPLILSALACQLAHAAEEASPEAMADSSSGAFIEVIGADDEDLKAVPGAAEVIDREEIKTLQPLSGNDVFRAVSGINVVEEEGIGLRMNLGFRGLDPDRSRMVLVMEDGVPLALAPYSSPELYYTPMIERMARVEVVKGSGSIQWGPSTIGGVVNFITPDPPQRFETQGEVRLGTFGYNLERLDVGNSKGTIGYRVQGLFQHYTGPRQLDLTRMDLTSKLKLELTPQSSLRLKLSLYDELSKSTYLGLTTPQFEADPTLNPAIHDRFHIQRLGFAISHQFMTDRLLTQTTAYLNLVSRHWRRQDYERVNEGNVYEREVDANGQTIDGDDISISPSDDGSNLYFLETAGHRNREYQVAGVESRLTRFFTGARLQGELEAGARLHHEESLIRYLVSSNPEAESGEITSDEARISTALSGFLQGQLTAWGRLRTTAGLRLETIVNTRNTYRTTSDASAGEEAGSGDTIDLSPPGSGTDTIVAWIPGLGASYDALDTLTLFGGVHRGFAPPRNQDAITSSGEVLELEAESSWNLEAGGRWHVGNRISGELTGFWMDFSNQIIPPSESSGAVSEATAVNSGATRHAGVEVRFKSELLKPGTGFLTLPLSGSYTFVHSRFMEGWSEVITGNVLPYAPEQLASLQLGAVLSNGFSARLMGNYVGAQFTDKENTFEASPDGTRGLIEAHTLLDASLGYQFRHPKMELTLSAKNITNEIYIASRRPAGIQPGSPRQLMLTWSGEF